MSNERKEFKPTNENKTNLIPLSIKEFSPKDKEVIGSLIKDMFDNYHYFKGKTEKSNILNDSQQSVAWLKNDYNKYNNTIA